ncbi:hypothetical protein MUK42_10604 [Musa troglodytarum]|uniref:Uncharacterized protein n=1 Tax=Musa troglodytarum TaxID=320322 RepID=A0A9E7GS07_9LILI|nr:hypothetical protein MUK42_10604 [Musa troglodytarum]
MRALFGGLACLFCFGLLVSMAKPGAATRIIAPPVADPTVPSPGAHHTRLDPFYSSKRRVPNGADPIHNRILRNLSSMVESYDMLRLRKGKRSPTLK